MQKFYLKIWAFWAFWITFSSILSAVIISFILTIFTYFSKDIANFDKEILTALADIFKLYFFISWGATFLISLFLSMRKILYRCFDHYHFVLYRCDLKEQILDVGLDDVIKLWRKWLFLTVWSVAFFIIIGMSISYIFSENSPMFWFNIYWLYAFVMLSGVIIIPLITLKCKMIKIQKC
jgi:hypothetical protein